MNFKRSLLLVVFLGVPLAASYLPAISAAADESWLAERGRLRDTRARFRQQVLDDRLLRAELGAELLDELIGFAGEHRAMGQDATLYRMLAQLEKLDAARIPDLKQRIEQLAPEPKVRRDEADHCWEQQLEATAIRLTRRPMELLERSLSVGSADVSAELIEEILAFHPNCKPLREMLGQQQFEGQWLSRFAYSQARRGFVWDDQYGWKLATETARYERGDYWDPELKTWLPMETANSAHAEPEHAWEIPTEHLKVRGTVKLARLAVVARTLEAFYSRLLTEYPRFFAKDRRLVLGTGEHSPLVVSLFRNREQYRRACPHSVLWSLGVYDIDTRSSCFYGDQPTLMYHEFTHQMLHVFAGGNSSPAWLTEGIAVYNESARFEDGCMVLGGAPPDGKICRHLERFRQGQAMPAEEVVRISSFHDWTATDVPQRQYQAAGALVAFCMEGRGGAYRDDFIDFLRDSYRGTTAGRQLWDYAGYDRESFFAVYEAWLQRMSRSK